MNFNIIKKVFSILAISFITNFNITYANSIEVFATWYHESYCGIRKIVLPGKIKNEFVDGVRNQQMTFRIESLLSYKINNSQSIYLGIEDFVGFFKLLSIEREIFRRNSFFWFPGKFSDVNEDLIHSSDNDEMVHILRNNVSELKNCFPNLSKVKIEFTDEFREKIASTKNNPDWIIKREIFEVIRKVLDSQDVSFEYVTSDGNFFKDKNI